MHSQKITPKVLQCGSGYQWDYYLNKCVPVCSSGYHNDSITGACVVDGGNTNTLLTVKTNSNNPQDFVGSNHNEGMSQIMPNYDNGQLDPTEQNVLPKVKTFLLSKGYDTTIFNSCYNESKQLFGSNFIYQGDIPTIRDESYANGIISAEAKNFLTNLSNTFKSFAGDSIAIPTQTAYDTYANSLIQYENEFASDLSLDSADRYLLYSAFSVARYSVVYAINYAIQHPDNIIVARTMQTSSFWPKWLSWGSVGSHDITGAIGGAAGAAIVTAGSGGALAPSIPITAAGAGVANSIANLGDQIFHHYAGTN